MQQLIDYLLKLSGTLMVLYLFYRLVLCRLTFHVWNRWYLLGYSLAAFFIPLVDIHPMLQRAQLNERIVGWVPVVSFNTFTENTDIQSGSTPDLVRMIVIVFLVGIFLLLTRLVIRYFSVARIRNSSQLLLDGQVKIYHVDDDVAPFSFGNAIFINRNKHTEEELFDIIRHEFIHVKQKHTIDILFSECLCIINWYNPFAWLLRNAIRQNLEFIADHQVLRNGIDRKKYQYLLLKVVGVPQSGLANNFNFTSLKKRIAMMNKLRSAKIQLVKFLFVLPLLTIVLLAFRNHQVKRGAEENGISSSRSVTKEQPVVSIFSDTIPKPKEPVKVQPPHVVRPNEKGFILTVTADQEETIVVVRDKQNKIVKAVSFGDWQKAAEKFESEYGKLSSEPAPEVPAPPAAPVPAEPPVGGWLPDNVSSIHIKDKIVTIGLKSGKTEVYDLNDPKQQKEFTETYQAVPRSAKNPPPVKIKPNPDSEPNKPNAPLIIDETSVLQPGEQLVLDSMVPRKSGDDVFVFGNKGKVTIQGLGEFDGLVIFNGKEYDIHSFNSAVKLYPADVQSVDVLSGDKARQLYGDKGKNGVIRITTKK